MSKQFLDKGIKLIKAATAADEAENYQVAFNNYIRGVEYLQTALKCTLPVILRRYYYLLPSIYVFPSSNVRRRWTQPRGTYYHCISSLTAINATATQNYQIKNKDSERTQLEMNYVLIML
jgi:hypothetical protein